MDTLTMHAVALIGWEDELLNKERQMQAQGVADWESIWYRYAEHHGTVRLSEVGPHGTLLNMAGGSDVEIEGDVGANAIVLVAGGGATVFVGGNVGPDAKIHCSGGGAKVIVIGTIHPTAQVVARGGAAEVIEIGRVR